MNERFKLIIINIGLKNKELAKELGVTPSAISDIINGRVKKISGSILIILELKYGVNPVWLLTGKGEMFLTSPPSPLLEERGVELPEFEENNMSKSTSQKKQTGHLSGINGNVETFPQVDDIEKVARSRWWDLLSAVKQFIFAGLDEIQDPEFLSMLKNMINFQVLKERAEKEEAQAVSLKKKGEAG